MAINPPPPPPPRAMTAGSGRGLLENGISDVEPQTLTRRGNRDGSDADRNGTRRTHIFTEHDVPDQLHYQRQVDFVVVVHHLQDIDGAVRVPAGCPEQTSLSTCESQIQLCTTQCQICPVNGPKLHTSQII